MKPIVQISLDLTNIEEALETAALAMRAGVDWLEAGTPLILAEGLHGVRKLREAFPQYPHSGRPENHGRGLLGGGNDGEGRCDPCSGHGTGP